MQEKLTFSDIVDLFAAKSGQSKKDAEIFMRELISLVSSKMGEEELVKMKDFGTFKVVEVGQRDSVNVNTGEKIEIPAHKKISFVPDKVLFDLVNKPFAHFEPELLNDGVDLEQTPETIESVVDVEDEQVETLSSVVEDTSSEVETLSEKLIPSVAENNEPLASPVVSEQDIEPKHGMEEVEKNDEIEEEVAVDETPKWKRNTFVLWLIAALLFLLVLIGGALLYCLVMNKNFCGTSHPKQQVSISQDTMQQKHPNPKPQKVDSDTIEAISPKKKQIVDKESSVAKPKGTTVTVPEGATFRTLALKYYGSKEFWIYIYNANKSTIPNPNLLHSGMKVFVPNAAWLGIDVHNGASVRKAVALGTKFLNENAQYK